jgi:Na+-transporting NADH:ubiquinone oxidoreductase subunit A
MPHHRLRTGLDLPLAGAAAGAPVELPDPELIAYHPLEFGTQIPTVLAQEGERVVAGQPLFASKAIPGLTFPAPVAGTVVEVRRGARRALTAFVMRPEPGAPEADVGPRHDPGAIRRLGADAVTAALLRSGLWAYLRTRPLNHIATPGTSPQSILVCGTETGPCQAGPDALIGPDEGPALQAGLDALAAFGAPVRLTTAPGHAHRAFSGLQGVEVHTFGGPHPSGDPAVQVNLVDPPRGARRVWWIRAHEVVLIGRLLLEGTFPARRVFSVAGAGAVAPRHVRTLMGAPLVHVVGAVVDGPVRWIRGSVLTGEAVDPSDFLSFYARTTHLLPEGVERSVLGWTAPQLGTWSAHRGFWLGLVGAAARRFDLRPGMFGGERAMIPTGALERVIQTPDLLPEQLFRSVAADDLEEAIKLGLLDISPEEAALLTYVCPSKVAYDQLLRRGLAQFEREG